MKLRFCCVVCFNMTVSEWRSSLPLTWSLTVETCRILVDPGRNPVVSLALSPRDLSQLSLDYRRRVNRVLNRWLAPGTVLQDLATCYTDDPLSHSCRGRKGNVRLGAKTASDGVEVASAPRTQRSAGSVASVNVSRGGQRSGNWISRSRHRPPDVARGRPRLHGGGAPNVARATACWNWRNGNFYSERCHSSLRQKCIDLSLCNLSRLFCVHCYF